MSRASVFQKCCIPISEATGFNGYNVFLNYHEDTGPTPVSFNFKRLSPNSFKALHSMMMKKVYVIGCFCGLVVMACTHKSGPVITRRTNEPPAPHTASLVKPDLVKGQALFTERCGRCHGLPDPGKYKVNRWEGILSAMAPKARLSKEEQAHVTAYINAHAAE